LNELIRNQQVNFNYDFLEFLKQYCFDLDIKDLNFKSISEFRSTFEHFFGIIYGNMTLIFPTIYLQNYNIVFLINYLFININNYLLPHQFAIFINQVYPLF